MFLCNPAKQIHYLKMAILKTFDFVFTSCRDFSSYIQLERATVQGGCECGDCNKM